MAIVLDIKQILDKNTVENERIEYKEGWNPLKIMHSLCAFANDIENQSGGYIIVGIKDADGRPGEVLGIDPASVDKYNGELLKLYNLIDPRYLAYSASYEYDGKTVFVIKAPAGYDRPYRCPTRLMSKDSDNKSSDKAYYIRKMGRTIVANASDRKALFELSATVPFDDRTNPVAEVSDLKLGLMQEFLINTRSRLYEAYKDLNGTELADNMHMVRGPLEDRHPINVGLMFFNDRPDDFFPYARVEIVYKPDPAGFDMRERTVTGPLDRQIRTTVDIIRNYYLEEYVTKQEDRPEAIRVFNYPMAAVEETVTNAVYHRGYDSNEPITIYILPDRIEVTSTPGPDRSISDEDLHNGILRSKTNRNRRVGELLKELRLAEGRNTGIPLIQNSLRENGSDPATFETDKSRSYLTVTLPINEHFLPKTAVEQPKEAEDPQERMFNNIVSLLRTNGPMSVNELAVAMGYKSANPSIRQMIKTMMLCGKVHYLYPESPRAGKQKIVLDE